MATRASSCASSSSRGCGVEDAEAADDDAVRRGQGRGRVEADGAEDACHEGVLAEPGVEAGVGHDDAVGVLEHGGAHRVLAGTDRGGEAGRGDLLLLRRGDEVDRGAGDRAHLGGDVDEGLELALGRVAEHVVAGQRVLASLGRVEDVRALMSGLSR